MRERIFLRWLVCAATVFFGVPSMAAAPKPAFLFESLLETYFDDESGLISFDQYDLAFAPEAPLRAEVAVVNSENTVIARFPFFEDYRWREGVFARAMVRGPADVTLTEPGVYNIVFLVDGEPASRLAVALEQTSAGEDPFDPRKTFRFYGMWQVYAHLNTQTFKEEPHYELTFWVGGRDLAPGTTKDMFFVTVSRDGEVIGHSKREQGFIADGHYARVSASIFRPHDPKKSVNAELLPAGDWQADGTYEVEVRRKSDDAVIRTFHYTAEGGKIVALPSTELGFEPRIDYLVPRVGDRATQQYDFEQAVWIMHDPAAGKAAENDADEPDSAP
jgi:hypothetical protein